MPFDDDGEDLEALLRSLKHRFESIFRRYRIPPEDAEDVLQTVMVQFVMKQSQIRNPPAWVCRSLELQCLMHLRTTRRRIYETFEETIIELLAGGTTPDPERKLMKDRLGRWIGKLPWKCRNLIQLKFGDDLDAEAIARRTGYKKSSVDKVTRRCVAALRKKFDTAARAIGERGQRGEP